MDIHAKTTISPTGSAANPVESPSAYGAHPRGRAGGGPVAARSDTADLGVLARALFELTGSGTPENGPDHGAVGDAALVRQHWDLFHDDPQALARLRQHLRDFHSG